MVMKRNNKVGLTVFGVGAAILILAVLLVGMGFAGALNAMGDPSEDSVFEGKYGSLEVTELQFFDVWVEGSYEVCNNGVEDISISLNGWEYFNEACGMGFPQSGYFHVGEIYTEDLGTYSISSPEVEIVITENNMDTLENSGIAILSAAPVCCFSFIIMLIGGLFPLFKPLAENQGSTELILNNEYHIVNDDGSTATIIDSAVSPQTKKAEPKLDTHPSAVFDYKKE
tara:strand:+ start:395 stop:1075 length:681 start_codon:yes stop_codon:yes gene_type:complete